LARFFRNVAATAEHLAHLTVWTPACRQAPHKPVGCCRTLSALTSSVPHACARHGALRPCPCAGRLTTPSYAPTKEALSLASIEKSVKNWSVFTKTGEIVSDQFHRFSINRTVNLIFFKTLNFLKKMIYNFDTGLPVIPTGKLILQTDSGGFQPLSVDQFTGHTDR
jgi:hypothetical protein